jgi:hypothetical protein
LFIGLKSDSIRANIRANETQKKIMALMVENPGITAQMLAAESASPERADDIRWHMAGRI